MTPGRRLLVAVAALAPLVAAGYRATAQRLNPRRPRTLIVGTPNAPSATDRVDGHRSGRAASPLPRGPLRIAWRRQLAMALERAPLVLANGDVVLVGGRGEILTVDADDGTDRQRVAVGGAAAGAAALTSDGTVVFVSPLGEAVGARGGVLRFRTRIPADRTTAARVAPLPLADGGVALAAGAELLVLDAEGNVRARRTLPEAPAVPLVDARGMIVAVSASGAAYGWVPDREPTRIGSFGGPVDEGVAFDGDRTLLAVVANRQLTALDLDRGVATTRATPAAGLLLGPPSLVRGLTYAFVHGTSSTLAVAFDQAGREAWSARIATFTAPLAPDGGAAALSAPPHEGVLVDGAGTLAFVTPVGYVGVVTGCGAQSAADRGSCVLDVLGEPPCVRGLPGDRGAGIATGGQAGGRGSSGVAGVAPAGAGSFVVACASGAVVKVTSATRPE